MNGVMPMPPAMKTQGRCGSSRSVMEPRGPRSLIGAPAGSWILYRPTNDRRVVHARVIDPKRDGVILVVRVYDVERGTYLGQERSDEKASAKANGKKNKGRE